MSVLCMIFGVVSFTFVVSNINSILSLSHKTSMRRTQNLMVFEAMKAKYDFSREVIAMAEAHISRSERLVDAESFQSMIGTFPAHMRSRLLYSMHRRSLSRIAFFRGLPVDIINVLGQALQPVTYPKGKPAPLTADSRIYSRGNAADKIFFIAAGAAVMVSEDYSGLPLAVYEAGSFFGDVEVFKNADRCFSVNSLTRLEVLTLSKSSFKRIFHRQFPVLGHLFLDHIDKRWSSIQEILELIDDFFNPGGANRSGRRLVESIQEGSRIISKLSRKNSLLRSG